MSEQQRWNAIIWIMAVAGIAAMVWAWRAG